MLTIRIKNRATIGNLQGAFEASIMNRSTWRQYAYLLDRIVKFLGPDKSPDDVFRQDVANLKAYLVEHFNYSEARVKETISVGSSYYKWMMDFGFATANPFYNQRRYPKDERPIRVIVT